MKVVAKNLTIRKVVIPAAGLGTRCLPLSKSVPKELLPVFNRPIIDWIVRDAVQSGISTVILVISSEKKLIKDYFSQNPKLEQELKERGKTELLKEVQNIHNLAKFIYVDQPEPLGNGHAILMAEKAVGNEPFVAAWGDDIFLAHPPVIEQLKKVFNQVGQSTIALVRASKDQFEDYCSRYGCADVVKHPSGGFKIKKFVEKPAPTKAPSRLFAVGNYLFTPEIFTYLKKTKPGKGGEIWLADALDQMARDGKVYGCEVKGKYLDLGDPLTILKASLTLALKDPKIKDDFKSFLKNQIT